jgi:hypothetical protein
VSALAALNAEERDLVHAAAPPQAAGSMKAASEVVREA